MPRPAKAGSVYKKREGDAHWWGAYYDPSHGGRRRTVKLFTDRGASEAELAKRIRSAERIASGLEDPTPPSTPIDHLVDDYLRHCATLGKQCDPHLKAKRLHLRRIIDGTGARTLAEVRLTDVEGVLRELAERGLSPRTLNIHRNSWRAFVGHCEKRGHRAKDRFDLLAKVDERRDIRRKRRALSEEEVRCLLRVARLRPVADYGRLTVPLPPEERVGRKTWRKEPLTPGTIEAAYERGKEAIKARPAFLAQLEAQGQTSADLYLLLVMTGCRTGDARRLRWADIHLDERYLVIHASQGKAPRDDEIPLHAAVVTMLRRRGPGMPSDRVFPSIPSIRGFDLDLAAAGIPKHDASGRVVDLHALRTTTGTMLARAGVTPQVAQRIMRHATIATTLRHYTDLQRRDQLAGIDRLALARP